MTESQLQSQMIAWFRNTFNDRTSPILFAIPNGGNRSPSEGQKLKREGVLAGVPDLCCVGKNILFFVEVKKPCGSLSEGQKNIITKMKSLSVPVFVVRSLDEFKAVCHEQIKK